MKRVASLMTCAILMQSAAVCAQTATPAQQVQSAQAVTATKPGEPEVTTASFGDWQLRCRAAIPAAAGQPAIPRSCEVVQSVMLQGQSAPFAQLAFGKTAPNEPMFFTMVLPTNIALPSTVKVSLDEKDKQPVDLAWTRCMPGGCFASVVTKDDFIKRWRAQEESGRFTFKNSGGQDVTLPFSFRGLSRALDALAKEA